jgi:hypothetical protein
VVLPIVWMLGASKVLDLNSTYAAYMLGSIFGKVIFSTLVVESHTQLLYEFLLLASRKTNLGDAANSEDSAGGTQTPHSPSTPKTKRNYDTVSSLQPTISTSTGAYNSSHNPTVPHVGCLYEGAAEPHGTTTDNASDVECGAIANNREGDDERDFIRERFHTREISYHA